MGRSARVRGRLIGRVNAARRAVPDSWVPAVAGARARVDRRRPSQRENARRQVEFLLGASDVPREDVDRAVAEYIDYSAWRAESRWHVGIGTAMRVEGLAGLRALHDRREPCILNFIHHGPWEGALASIARLGVILHVVVTARMMEPDGPEFLHQVARVGTSTGNQVLDVRDGVPGILKAFGEGKIVGIASDVKGETTARFMGREVKCVFGTPYLAFKRDVPVVTMTIRRDERGEPYALLTDPWYAADFDDAGAMHQAILDHHADAVAAWPAAYDQPLDRFVLGTID